MADLERDVAGVRALSRQLVRELDFLRGRCLPTRHSPSECHVLVELDRERLLTIAELADRLRLDKSTTSRVVCALAERGHVRVQPDPQDQRRKPVCLTANGRRQVAKIHQAANATVAAALDQLTDSERSTVLNGIALYVKSLQRSRAMQPIEIRPIRPSDDPRVTRIIRDVMTEFGATGPGYSFVDPEVEAMSQAYPGDGAHYFVAVEAGRLLGGAGVAPLEGGTPKQCELRKMYVVTEGRGKGIGKALLEACLEAATEFGYRTCYLETLDHMSQAQKLYESFGFERLEAALGQTGHTGCNRFYAKTL